MHKETTRMPYSAIAYIAPNFRDYKNEWLKAYEPGTTTPKSMSTDSTLSTLIAKAQLNVDGFIVSAGGALIIPYIDGAYDLWLFPTEAEADTNNTSNAIRLADNLTGGLNQSGLNSALINDLSQAYEFDTVTLMTSSIIDFPVKKVIHVVGDDSTWDVFAIATKAVSTDVINNNSVNRQYIKREGEKEELPDADLSNLFNDQRSVVVAGDSLSYNAFDWPVPTNALYAYDNSPGLMAWSHMLRDFCHRSDINFIHADNTPFSIEGGAIVTVNPETNTNKYFYPFNNRLVKMIGHNKTDIVRFVVPCNKDRTNVRLYCVNQASSFTADAGKVDVSFKVYPYTAASTFKITIETGGRTDYLELEPYFADFGDTFAGTYPILVELSNWRTNGDLDPPAQGIGFILSAFGEKFTDFRLTGHGGYSMAQVDAEKTTMITNFAPELLFLICGANDRFAGVTSASFIASLTSVVNATRLANPLSEIIFMTPTHASDAMFAPGIVLNGETIEEWLRAVKQAALGLGCRYFDTYDLFAQNDASQWRFDNVHMTKYGNKVLFDALNNRFFSSAIANNRIDLADPKPTSQFAEFKTDKLGYQNIVAGSNLYKFDQPTLLYNLQTTVDAQAVIKSVERVDAITLKISTNYPIIRDANFGNGEGQTTLNVTLTKKGSGALALANTIIPVEISRTTYSISFFLIDYSVSPPAVLTDLQNNDQEYFVSWS